MSKTEVKINPIEIDLSDEVENILKKAGRNCSELIKRNAPRRTGEYANGWTYKLESSETVVVYNKGKEKTLSHLLELGHRTKLNRGRKKVGRKATVPPQEHIRPAYNKIAQEYEEDMKKIKLKVTIKH